MSHRFTFVVAATLSASHEHGGRTYHFCSARCAELFAEQPNAYLGN